MKLIRSAAFVFMILCVTHPAAAQQASSARLGVGAKLESSSTARTSADTTAPRDSTRSAGRVLRAAGAGAGIGALVGLASAFFITHHRHYPDHSEDGLVIVPLLLLGSVSGLLIGAVVGYYRN